MNFELAQNITSFLVSKTDCALGVWSGRLSKKEQISLFGVYFGKGLIVINGQEEKVTHSVKACFGTDFAWTGWMKFDGSELVQDNRMIA